jgi:hypothetical protein
MCLIHSGFFSSLLFVSDRDVSPKRRLNFPSRRPYIPGDFNFKSKFCIGYEEYIKIETNMFLKNSCKYYQESKCCLHLLQDYLDNTG